MTTETAADVLFSINVNNYLAFHCVHAPAQDDGVVCPMTHVSTDNVQLDKIIQSEPCACTLVAQAHYAVLHVDSPSLPHHDRINLVPRFRQPRHRN